MKTFSIDNQVFDEWEYYRLAAEKSLDGNLLESVDNYIKAIETVPEDKYNLLYDSIVKTYAEYLISKAKTGDAVTIEPLVKLGRKTDEFSLNVHELHLGIMNNILKKFDFAENDSFKKNLFSITINLTRQFFTITTSIESMCSACSIMSSLSKKMELSGTAYNPMAVKIYRTLFDQLYLKMNEMAERDLDLCLECIDEWRFSDKPHSYVDVIDELFETAYSYIRMKRNVNGFIEECSVLLERFDKEFFSIMG